MTNYVTYQVALTQDNAALIDQLNSLLISGYTAPATSAKAEPKAEPKATPTKKATKAEPEADEDVPTMADFKAAAKAAKAAHGEEFTKQAIEDAGVESKPTLGRAVSAADPSQYQAIMDAWVAGPQETEEDEDDDLGDDDDFGDDDDDSAEVTAEAVKTALKAYAKDTGRDEAREIMQKHGAASLSKVDDLSPAKLAALLKALV